jgi:hypothetical protein
LWLKKPGITTPRGDRVLTPVEKHCTKPEKGLQYLYLKKKGQKIILRYVMMSQGCAVDKMLINTKFFADNIGDNMGITKRSLKLSLLPACAIISAL